MDYDEIFVHKLKALKHILETDLDEQYQKVNVIFNWGLR